MREKYRLYYYSLLGAAGGLTGWFLQAVLYRGVQSQEWRVLAPRGAILGALIGVGLAAYEGIASRSFIRFVAKFGAYGLGLGLLAGGLALPLAQEAYCRLGACVQSATSPVEPGLTILLGIVCWALFGGLIGLIEGVGKGTQFYKGLLGGLLGGAIGGCLHEPVRVLKTTDDPLLSQVLIAVSLTFLGACIGLAVSLVATLLSEATIEVLDGKIAKRVYDVTQYVDRKARKQTRGIIGKDKTRANIFLPGDEAVLPQHAYIGYANEEPTISASPEAQKNKVPVLLNGRPVVTFPLSNNDIIKIGNTSLQYHQLRKKKKR